MPYRERFITSFDNLSLYLRDYGNRMDSRTPLLCLGGLTRNSKDFDSFAEWYSADGRRVICPDYRGRGRSAYDRNWRNYNPSIYIRDIQDILTTLNACHVIVLGTSLGGMLGMAMAAVIPSALAGLVMNDIGPKIETDGLKLIVEYINKDRPQDDWDSAVTAIRRMLPDLVFQDEGAWLKMTQNTFRECDDGKLRFDWDVKIAKTISDSGYVIPDMWKYFKALQHIPALALRGQQSNILSPSCFTQMKVVKPDLFTVEIPRAGHTPTLAEPESLAALDEFFQKY